MDYKHIQRQGPTWVKQVEVYVIEITDPMDAPHSGLMQSVDVRFSCGTKASMSYYFGDPTFAIDLTETDAQWYDVRWKNEYLQCRPAKAKEQVKMESTTDWEAKNKAIAYGKTKCRLVCSAIESGQIMCDSDDHVRRLAELIFEPRKEQENESISK
ncbi:hypothetical protein LCGC14_1283370 [marine sediment metagenome]|uniref:Uncharacterized protein n=1 Tax=marine sediment metagenome TaxID=412755 RepID=A0A0F9NB60_9ZZZZ